jgi:3',5'-cyclic AMP phosphodiesterase CpdA
MNVRRIAQITDLHLLSFASDGVAARADARTRFVSLGRRLDPHVRRERAAAALSIAWQSGADHVVLSGDLTELGSASEFEVVAEVLAASPFHPHQLTLVPGNHDRYAEVDGWGQALAGPLAPWARRTSGDAGTLIDLGHIRLLPLDVTRPQSVMRSAGFLTEDVMDRVQRTLADPAVRARPVAIVQHHAPFNLAPVMHLVDGLIGCERLTDVVERHEAVQVVHGHLHRHTDRGDSAGLPRYLGARAVVDDASALRLYDVTADGLAPTDGLDPWQSNAA